MVYSHNVNRSVVRSLGFQVTIACFVCPPDDTQTFIEQPRFKHATSFFKKALFYPTPIRSWGFFFSPRRIGVTIGALTTECREFKLGNQLNGRKGATGARCEELGYIYEAA